MRHQRELLVLKAKKLLLLDTEIQNAEDTLAEAEELATRLNFPQQLEGSRVVKQILLTMKKKYVGTIEFDNVKDVQSYLKQIRLALEEKYSDS